MTTTQENTYTCSCKDRLAFICTCKGCLGIPARFDSYYVEEIVKDLQGFYFSPNTRKAWGTRLTGFYKLASGGVLITSTQKAFNTGRDINHAYFCKYGHLVDHLRLSTKSQARKALFTLSDKVLDCDCHGCQIDRAGRL